MANSYARSDGTGHAIVHMHDRAILHIGVRADRDRRRITTERRKGPHRNTSAPT